MASPTDTGGPLTPAMLATIQAVVLRERRIYRRWTVVFAALTVFFVVIFALVQNPALLTFSVITAFFMLLFLIVGQIASRAVARRMLGIAYIRVAGPLQVQSYQAQSAGSAITRHRLTVGEQQIHLDPQIAKALEKMTAGTAIYVPFTYGRSILLEVLDEQGNVIYRRKGYSP